MDAIERVVAFGNFHLHLAAPWQEAYVQGDQVVAHAADGTHRCDHVIAGTGYFVDPSDRPEIASFADKILLWQDQYTPPADEADPFLGRHPYLGEAHEYLEKTPGCATSTCIIQPVLSALVCQSATCRACGAICRW